MICGTFWRGSGIGNQLHRYVMTRVLADLKGFEWGMEYPENFKGRDFMQIDTGLPVIGGVMDQEGGTPLQFPEGIEHFYREYYKDGYDWIGINGVQDRTKIDGEFQGEGYFNSKLRDIDEWLKTEPLDMPHDLCVINFRGGEYKYVPELFLPQEYWDEAVERMCNIYPRMRFEVHTDDPETAKQFFPEFPCVHDIGINWRAIRNAHYLILSNSSFAILPALLNKNAKVIYAPKYWARRNAGFWMLPYNKYDIFTHI